MKRTKLIIGLLCCFLSSVWAESDFPSFWTKFKMAVSANDRAAVASMTKFPLPFYQSEIKNRAEFLRRYNEIFNGEANATQCFAGVQPTKESGQFKLYCPFKGTPNDLANAPICFSFEKTEAGWKFAGLDNINE